MLFNVWNKKMFKATNMWWVSHKTGHYVKSFNLISDTMASMQLLAFSFFTIALLGGLYGVTYEEFQVRYMSNKYRASKFQGYTKMLTI